MKTKTSTKNSVKKSTVPFPLLQNADVVDLILLDHKFMKECIETLTDQDADRRKVLSTAKEFLPVLKKHSEAEEKTIYPAFESNKVLKSMILEGEVEHGLVDQKVKMLLPKITKARSLSDELVAELKVTAELVKHHVREEESELLPKIKSEIKEEVRLKLGAAFAKVRKFNDQEMDDMPQLNTTLLGWREEMKDLSHRFVKKMDQYVGSLKR